MPVFSRDKREAFARRSCSIKNAAVFPSMHARFGIVRPLSDSQEKVVRSAKKIAWSVENRLNTRKQRKNMAEKSFFVALALWLQLDGRVGGVTLWVNWGSSHLRLAKAGHPGRSALSIPNLSRCAA
jgi:hypothetical protein